MGSGTNSGVRNAFGDIAITPSGTLYAYTAGGQGGNFYSLDLTTGTTGTDFRDIGGASISFVPEPTALALVGTAAAAIATTLRRRCRRASATT